MHGAGSEQNALMALVILSPWALVVKLGLPALFGVRHLLAPLERSNVRAIACITCLYCAVVTWNAVVIGRGLV